MLPSPSSMNFPNPAILPPISPPHSHVQTSTQASHLQDLQHQVSIKTLAYQTLQREYDSLLQKLERQRTKCATLEKKFEVSDVEINSLTDEKEKLQVQIAGFEAQVEELQQSRDEARRQLVANGAQYMRIMEMASRLQAQGAEDRRHWEVEKGELEGRIKTLEEAMVTGPEWPDASHRNEPGRGNLAPSPPMSSAWQMSSSTSSSAETVTVLRAEIGRLRARTQSLEQALQAMRDESVSIQVAAQTIVASGGKMKEAIDTGLGE
jgi:DNA repair exonuclease SbcCD ATPase subunit